MQERIYFYVVLLIITQEVVNSIGIVTMLTLSLVIKHLPV